MNNDRTNSVVFRLIEHGTSLAQDDVLIDVRLGLGYSAVGLQRGGFGLSWSPKVTGHACSVFAAAGTLVGRRASEVIPWLADPDHPWQRVVGLATLNAVLNHHHQPPPEATDIMTRLALQPEDRVAMVGRFQPLLPAIRSSTCHLDIIEFEPTTADALTPREGSAALQSCTIAILTGTSLITGTLAGLLSDLAGAAKRPRAAILLGPSVPLLPEAFRGTAITHLAGSWVRDGRRVMHIVSEGGGTPQLKPSLVPVTLEAT
jgi:uncharacterized protein